jgi:DnaJ-class molecular chaperone
MSVEFKDYYRVLGVPPKATDEEIKKAFRTLDEVLTGAMRSISVRRTNAHTGQEETQTYSVRIPAGVRAGQSIRVPGKGGEGARWIVPVNAVSHTGPNLGIF